MECSHVAPGLVQAYHKFKDRQVAFVSLTDMPESAVQVFADRHNMPWPSGFGASRETLVRLGVVDGRRIVPGYAITPTLYLVGPDGKVLWSDEQARMRHEDRQTWQQRVEAAIEAVLRGDMPDYGVARPGL